MTWDAECEAKAWELMGGFVNDEGKPTRWEQEKVANWLNQMLPYPGWRFRLSSSGNYWVVSSNTLTLGVIFGGATVGDAPVDGKYTNSTINGLYDTIMEILTKLEMKL